MIHLFEGLNVDERRRILTKTFSRFSLFYSELLRLGLCAKIWNYSWRTSGGANADLRTVACTGRLAMHLSTSRFIIRHGVHSRWQSLDAPQSTCTALPPGNSLGKFVNCWCGTRLKDTNHFGVDLICWRLLNSSLSSDGNPKPFEALHEKVNDASQSSANLSNGKSIERSKGHEPFLIRFWGKITLIMFFFMIAGGAGGWKRFVCWEGKRSQAESKEMCSTV